MRAWFLLGCVGAFAWVGCAGTNGGGSGANDAGTSDDASTDDGGDDAAGDDAGPVDKLTWTYIYTTYFASGATPGHCGNSNCHGHAQGGFLCGSKANCYSSITTNNPGVGGKMVDPKMPANSVLIDPGNSPVFWFDKAGGNMPQDRLVADDTAVTEITAWIMVGAPNN